MIAGPLIWLLLGPLLGARAWAVGNAGIPGQTEPTVQELSQDLGSSDAAERRYAARSLRMLVRQDVRRSARARAQSLDLAEALLALRTYDDQVAPACIEALSQAEATRACADILRLLETRTALEPLRQARQAEARASARRHLDRAIEFLELVQREDPSG